MLALAARESRTACTICPGAPSGAVPGDVSPPRATRYRVYGPPVDTWKGGPTVQSVIGPVGVAVSSVCSGSVRGHGARRSDGPVGPRTGRHRIYYYVLRLRLVPVGIMTILPLALA
jgi:hypothetical protein